MWQNISNMSGSIWFLYVSVCIHVWGIPNSVMLDVFFIKQSFMISQTCNLYNIRDSKSLDFSTKLIKNISHPNSVRVKETILTTEIDIHVWTFWCPEQVCTQKLVWYFFILAICTDDTQTSNGTSLMESYFARSMIGYRRWSEPWCQVSGGQLAYTAQNPESWTLMICQRINLVKCNLNYTHFPHP